MFKAITMTLVALCAAGMLSSCATHESTSSKAQPAGATSSGNVGAGAEGVNQPGRSDPSGASTGQSIETAPSTEPGRRDKQY